VFFRHRQKDQDLFAYVSTLSICKPVCAFCQVDAIFDIVGALGDSTESCAFLTLICIPATLKQQSNFAETTEQ
jgi:hypothetical protein